MSGGIQLDRIDAHGRGATIPSWFSSGSLRLFLIHTGENGSGNGGNGYFFGDLVAHGFAEFLPINLAEAGHHAGSDARQTNIAMVDQTAIQAAGIGDDGGNANAATGGAVTRGVLAGAEGHFNTGGNTAGNGGDGVFAGSMIHAPVAIYSAVNIATAGSHASAEAYQSNHVLAQQGAIQVAGLGGRGGNDNLAKGSEFSPLKFGSNDFDWIGSDVIATGNADAGNGGDGLFFGSMIHSAFVLYNPINIAVAGYGSSAKAAQTNSVDIDQSGFQMAGVGNDGGNSNLAWGDSLSNFLTGSDVIATGNSTSGNGGSGYFFGSLVDIDIAIFAPINIAVAGYNSTAEAHQTNNVHLDQGTTQIAAIGGDGGHGSFAIGDDIALQLIADHHLLEHGI
jgi:hypothetical protein